MNRLGAVGLALGALVVSSFGPANAVAQEAQLATIEGYAFDQESLRPLKNVRLFLNITEGSNGYGTGAVTDENGFYTLSFEPRQEITSIDFYGSCVGRSFGSVTKHMPVYVPSRPIVYQRNLYLKPPKGSSRCF